MKKARDDIYKFRLFTSGMSVNSANAIENLKNICDKHLFNRFELEIIDISQDKAQAAKHHIIALPTLIKYEPTPPRTIVGNLSNTEKVLKILDLP